MSDVCVWLVESFGCLILWGLVWPIDVVPVLWGRMLAKQMRL
jgi:hypothetical protein